MKQHTPELRQEILKLGREINNVITYNNTELTEELYSVSTLFEGNILKSIMKQLDVETSVNIPEGTIINYQLGVKVENDYQYLDYGNYIVYKNEILEDKKRYKLTCYDKMLYAMKQNEDLGITYPITIKNYLTAVATKIGLTVKNTTFNNESVTIPAERYVGLEYTYRDILDEIAQATGSIIVINANDQIEVKYPSNTGETLDEQFLKDINVKFGQKYGPINSIVLSRSGGSDNIYIQDDASVELNGLCELKIEDNQLMNFNDRDQYLQGLLTALDGLYFYINDFKSTGICYLEPADLYNVTIDSQTYQCFMLNDEINITGGIEELIHTEMPEESQTDYSKADKTDRRLNETYLIVDKQNQSIEAVIFQTIDTDNPDSTVNKVAELTLTVGELKSKISDATDTTITGESNEAYVELEGINESEPVTLKIRPIGSSISYLYPRNNLYPSDILYMPDRIVRFTNTTTSEVFDYTLPGDLLYYDGSTYDEFYLDYTEEVCQIVKKVGYNADGTTYALSTPITQTFEYPYGINLTEGDYTITIPGYSNAYLFVRLMSKNIYTSQFVTRVEEQSDIRQTADNINLSVDAKLTNYSTTTQMNSAIDLKANQITSTVSETYSTKTETTSAKNAAIAQANSDTDAKLENYSTTIEMNTAITQTANSITSTVNAKFTNYSTTTQMNSAINQKADEINIEVNKKVNNSDYTHAKIVAKINDSTSSVLIQADKINLTGYLTISSASSTYASKSSLSAGTTTINGGCITTGTIKSANYEAGTSGTSINLTNGVIDSKNFKINSSGNVTISGNITASSGYIGNSSSGFTIGSTKLYNGKSTLTANADGVYIGTDGISLGTGSTFKVTNAGEVTATSGKIGGWTITSSQMQAHNGQYYAYINNTSGTNKDFLFVENRVNPSDTSTWTYPVIIRANGYAKFDNIDLSGTITGSSISGSSISGGTITGSSLHGCSISGGSLEYNTATINNTLQLGANVGHPIFTLKVGNHEGLTGPIYLDGMTLSFYCGILIGVS